MNSETALEHVTNSLREGADLRNKLARQCGPAIVEGAAMLAECLESGGKLLFFGNGGSAADAQHLAAEFVGRFVKERRALPAIAFTTDSSIQALGQPNDVAVGISTSGNSPNVLLALKEASKMGLKTIGLAGKDGGELARCVDVPIVVPASNTARIQECHIAIGHLFCELVEEQMFPAQNKSVATGQLKTA
jgi:D-sedoheptulose 7-phosphate isomerase